VQTKFPFTFSFGVPPPLWGGATQSKTPQGTPGEAGIDVEGQSNCLTLDLSRDICPISPPMKLKVS